MLLSKKSYIAGLMLSVVACLGADTPCRSPSEQVAYESPGHHPSFPEEVDLIDLRTEKGEMVLLVRVPDYWKGVFQNTYTYLISKDKGKTWARDYSRFSISSITNWSSDIIRSPADGDVLYKNLYDEGGLFLRSTNGGVTWVKPAFRIDALSPEEFAERVGGSNHFFTRLTVAALDPRDALTIYASLKVIPWGKTFWGSQTDSITMHTLYVSHDGGETWTEFAGDMGNPEALRPEPLGISALDPTLMYAHSAKGVVRSTDGGKTWQLVGEAEWLEKPHGGQVFASIARGLVVHQFTLDPSDKDVVYILGNKGLYRSVDGGQSWCLLDVGFDLIDGILSMAVNPLRPEEIFVGTLYGLFYSIDRGTTWTKVQFSSR